MNFKTWFEQMPQTGVPQTPMPEQPPMPATPAPPMGGPQPPTAPPQEKPNPLAEDGEMERIFRQAKQRLTGGLKTDPTIALGKLEGGPKGAAEALKFVFNRLKELGEPWSAQSEDARNWLNQIGNGEINVSGSATVGHLLAKLFGKELYEKVMKQPAPLSDVKPLEKPEIPPPPNQQQRAAEEPSPDLAHHMWPTFRNWNK